MTTAIKGSSLLTLARSFEIQKRFSQTSNACLVSLKVENDFDQSTTCRTRLISIALPLSSVDSTTIASNET